MTPELAAAIAESYRALPAAQLRPPIGVCRCNVCVSEEDERALAATPREALSVDLIREFTNSAHGRNDELLRHFLPRMFELYALGESIHSYDDAWGFRGLGRGTDKVPQSGYARHFSAGEIAAIDGYFRALFRARIAALASASDYAPDVLEIVAFCGGDIAPLPADWDADRSRAATHRLAAFIVGVANRFWNQGAGRALGDHWEGAPAMAQLTLDYLKAPRHAQRFDLAMNDEADQAACLLLAEARAAFAAW